MFAVSSGDIPHSFQYCTRLRYLFRSPTLYLPKQGSCVRTVSHGISFILEPVSLGVLGSLGFLGSLDFLVRILIIYNYMIILLETGCLSCIDPPIEVNETKVPSKERKTSNIEFKRLNSAQAHYSGRVYSSIVYLKNRFMKVRPSCSMQKLRASSDTRIFVPSSCNRVYSTPLSIATVSIFFPLTSNVEYSYRYLRSL